MCATWVESKYASERSVRAGSGHVCSLQADGSVMCWGNNTWGQLLDGTAISSTIPIPAKL